MRSTKLLACLAVFAGAVALSCARGVEPDPEGTSEPGAASADTEEPTGAEETEEDAGGEEVAGTGDDGVEEEDEDRARDPGDIASDAQVREWPDAGDADAQQVVETDAGGALDAAVVVDAGPRAASESDAAPTSAGELDANTAQDIDASGSEDAAASTPATPTEPIPPASSETDTPTAPADEAQEPVPTPVDEPIAPPESESSACSSFDDCAQRSCFPRGLLPCCRADGSCGCSWAPGAYCL